MQESRIQRLEYITESYRDPAAFNSKDEHLRPLFKEIDCHKASDIIILESQPILINIQNKLYAATQRNITKTEAEWFLSELAGRTAIASINKRQAINTSYSLFQGNDLSSIELNNNYTRERGSYRVNVSGTRLRGTPSFQIVLRTIPSQPIPYDKLGMNEIFVKRCCPTNGIVLIAGVTGSGKSTTLASIIRYILENFTPIRGNIITHEEPIEYTFDGIFSEHSIVAQSQIPENFNSFYEANREALRRKPAGIVVGELRDTETITSAMEASLTGHPVFATVHAGSITDIITRLLTKFEGNKAAALYDIISTSSMFIAQRLIPDVKGKLFAVREHLYFTEDIKNKIKHLSDPNQINNVVNEIMQNGSNDPNAIASLTFENQGKILLQEGKINKDGFLFLKGQH